MEGRSDKFQVVAIDQRGYNQSDKPKGVENYDMKLLVGDVLAVIRHFGQEKAIIVGHDWGGAVAWSLAIYAPQAVDKLIILNLPHLRGLSRELANKPAAAKEQPVCARLSKARRRFETHARGAHVLGDRRKRQAALHRGIQELGFRGDAQLLQAELPA